MFVILLILVVILLVFVALIKGYENEYYFKNRNIKSIRSGFVFGSMTRLFGGKENIIEFVTGIYNKYPEDKVFGVLDFRTPSIGIRDPELLKSLVIKQFDHFSDHRTFVDDKVDALFGNSLFLLKGSKWRDMRSTLSPAFTGSKMRQMFQLILEVSDQMVTSLRNEAKTKPLLEYELKEICSRFTNDIIALCAFGIKVNSLNDRTNDFYMAGESILGFSKPKNSRKFMVFRFWPKLCELMGITIFDKTVQQFLKGMVLSNMKEREQKNIQRPDMINLLLEVRKGTLSHQNTNKEHDSAGFATVEESEIGLKTHLREWTDDELVAQCFLFFLAGFDTSSNLMSFAIYELVVNPEYQKRLYDEVKGVHDDLDGKKLTYDVLQKMKFIDMVTSETLRKWPPLAMTERYCVQDLYFDDGKGFKYQFDRTTGLTIPIAGFHYDPNYFPNPEKFDPDRFSDDNKHKINPDAYMPFGVGPRNCIGSRFALMEVKALLYHLILNFSFHAIEKTQIPVKLKKNVSTITAEDGIWIGFKLRE